MNRHAAVSITGTLEHRDPAVIVSKAATLNEFEKTTGAHYRMNSASSPELQP